VRATASEARPREVDVPVALAAGAVDLDRGLIVEFPQQVRRCRSLRDVDRLDEFLAVANRGPILAARVLVRPNPDIAECLRRAGRIARALRAREQSAVAVPREHWITRSRGAHLGPRRVRRAVARVARDERAGE